MLPGTSAGASGEGEGIFPVVPSGSAPWGMLCVPSARVMVLPLIAVTCPIMEVSADSDIVGDGEVAGDGEVVPDGETVPGVLLAQAARENIISPVLKNAMSLFFILYPFVFCCFDPHTVLKEYISKI